MAVLGGIGGTEYTLFSFFQRTKAIIAEAEHFISSEQLSLNDIDSLERIHERLSEAEDTVFTLKQRAFNLIKRRFFSMSRNTRSKPMTSLSMNFSNMAAVKERCSFCSTMNV